MNDRKSKFLSAVQILAPHDQFIYQAAQRIPAEQLPAYPGATALEFVVAVQKLRQPLQDLQIRATKNKQRSGSVEQKKLSLSHALRIKGAEYWLKLGDKPIQLGFDGWGRSKVTPRGSHRKELPKEVHQFADN